ncbi:unnamed protein product [Cuscuta campestris]|uniref:Uncharacterized protein n=1 Tax=Cuscuta campestris TaxID=132261 RepID=A0A484MN89_9ASTE|nr:unnamed protein product [Cuscuta campestris]
MAGQFTTRAYRVAPGFTAAAWTKLSLSPVLQGRCLPRQSPPVCHCTAVGIAESTKGELLFAVNWVAAPLSRGSCQKSREGERESSRAGALALIGEEGTAMGVCGWRP